MKEILKHIRIATIILATVVPAMSLYSFISEEETAIVKVQKDIRLDQEAKWHAKAVADSLATEMQKDSLKNAILEEATNYAAAQSPKSSETIPTYIVEMGLEHDIDICFMLSQTHLETSFGTGGIGKTRKSIFGVMKRSFNTYEDAIDHYVDMLKTSYLANGKTEEQLLQRYVNKNGYRYGASGYESHLRRYYDKITSNTRIKDLQQQYKELL